MIQALGSYPAAEYYWVQEEPEIMGAWRFVQLRTGPLGIDLKGVTRPESAAPATGSLSIHQQEQTELLDRAFAGL